MCNSHIWCLVRCSDLLHLAVLHPRKLSVYCISGNKNIYKSVISKKKISECFLRLWKHDNISIFWHIQEPQDTSIMETSTNSSWFMSTTYRERPATWPMAHLEESQVHTNIFIYLFIFFNQGRNKKKIMLQLQNKSIVSVLFSQVFFLKLHWIGSDLIFI